MFLIQINLAAFNGGTFIKCSLHAHEMEQLVSSSIADQATILSQSPYSE